MPSENRLFLDATSRTGIAGSLYAVEFGVAFLDSVINPTEVGNGIYQFNVPDDTKDYTVYEKSGANPAIGDTWLAVLTSADWTADERAAIRAILGIPASGTTPETPTSGVLAELMEDTQLIGTASAFTPAPVLSGNQLVRLVIGDDYLTEHNRQLTFTRTLTITPASTTLRFAKVMECGGTPETFNVTGSVSVTDGVLTCTFQINASDWAGVTAGKYSWIVEVVDIDGDVITAINSADQRVKFVEFQAIEGR